MTTLDKWEENGGWKWEGPIPVIKVVAIRPANLNKPIEYTAIFKDGSSEVVRKSHREYPNAYFYKYASGNSHGIGRFFGYGKAPNHANVKAGDLLKTFKVEKG